MLEDKVIQAFFALLRAGLWRRPVFCATTCFPLSWQEWDSLRQMAICQTVEGIIFDGIEQLEPGYAPPHDLLIKWLVRTEKIEQRNKWMDGILAEQARFLDREEVQPILLKGQGLASYYENPARRVCGDIDWYFGAIQDYTKANSAVMARGVELHYTAGYSASYGWRGGEVEHHRRLFDIHNPFLCRYLKGLEQKEAANLVHMEVHGSQVLLLAPLLNVIQVSAHILKHLLSFGIGLRQLCDVARLYYRCQDELDGQYLQHIYGKLGISKWVELLHVVLVRHLGLQKEFLPYRSAMELSPEWMVEEILQAGNFGFHDSRYQQQGISNDKREQATRRVWGNLRKYIRYAPMEAACFPVMHLYSRFSKKK